MTHDPALEFDGIEVIARKAGRDGRRRAPLLFLHGAFAGAWCWDEHFLSWFAGRGYDCYALSYRGHGESNGHQDLHELGIADFVQDVRSVVDRLQIQPVLVGHSMGGFIAMEYLMRRSAAGLALMASVPPSGLLGPSMSLTLWQPLLAWEIMLIQQAGPTVATPEGMHRALFSRETPDDHGIHHYGRMGNESRQATLDMHDARRIDVSRIDDGLPVLVLGAEDDGLIGRAYVRATAAAFGEKAKILPRTGHGIMLDSHWEMAAEQLLFWLRRNGF